MRAGEAHANQNSEARAQQATQQGHSIKREHDAPVKHESDASDDGSDSDEHGHLRRRFNGRIRGLSNNEV